MLTSIAGDSELKSSVVVAKLNLTISFNFDKFHTKRQHSCFDQSMNKAGWAEGQDRHFPSVLTVVLCFIFLLLGFSDFI